MHKGVCTTFVPRPFKLLLMLPLLEDSTSGLTNIHPVPHPVVALRQLGVLKTHQF
jgi:hypothetical protein